MIMRPRTALTRAAALLPMFSVTVPCVAQEETAEPTPRVHGEKISEKSVLDLGAIARNAASAAVQASEANTQITSRAEATARAAQSEAMQALIGEMTPQVLRALGVEDEVETASGSDAPPQDRPELAMLVFASSSIPMETMRAFAQQVEAIGGAIVLRGAVGGLEALGPTVDYIMDVLRVDPSCSGVDCDMREVSVLIDPVLFRQAGVTRVPAVAVVDHDPFQSYCERVSDDALHGQWRITYGDASLAGHLSTLASLGDFRARRLEIALNKEALE
ncbi:MAG: type-F conjugative transfer system pilin assembly protein TrbC [Pseudomonadota bacterium]